MGGSFKTLPCSISISKKKGESERNHFESLSSNFPQVLPSRNFQKDVQEKKKNTIDFPLLKLLLILKILRKNGDDMERD